MKAWKESNCIYKELKEKDFSKKENKDFINKIKKDLIKYAKVFEALGK